MVLAQAMLVLALGGPRILGGTPAEACQWPTAVAMRGASSLCTGTLVHPEIVLFAAHCESPDVVRFGESSSAPARTVAVDHCSRFIDEVQVGPDDYAYCRLAEPVVDIPITPVAYGCETALVGPGRAAVIAGFGETDGGSAGAKQWAETEIVAITQMVLVGKDGTSAWSGDSGGPALLRVPLDGSWRAFGIASGGTAPGMPIQYVQMHTAVPWVETNSGVDITPCHDVDGTWLPSAACGHFATDPMAMGDWNLGCDQVDPGAGVSGTCGVPFGSDSAAPTVEIVAPLDGETFMDDPSDVDIEVEAADGETGIRRVWLRVDAGDGPEDRPEDGEAPYAFVGERFAAGSYVLVAVAEDLAGNVGESEPIGIGVGDESSEGDDDEGTSGQEAGGEAHGSAPGCGCAASGVGHGAEPSLPLLALFGYLRRRRSRVLG